MKFINCYSRYIIFLVDKIDSYVINLYTNILKNYLINILIIFSIYKIIYCEKKAKIKNFKEETLYK